MSRFITINTGKVVVDNFPDQCGVCHKNVEPIFLAAYTKTVGRGFAVEAAFRCTNNKCESMIIGYYSKYVATAEFTLQRIAPVIPKGMDFNEEIKELSPNFVDIFNQSSYAEDNGLSLISGIGYRKSLEFLIKDYLISIEQAAEESIISMPLGACINKLENHNIREMAKRATWIGNDEAHYTRKWEGKDITDLKKLIVVTVHYISMDLTSRAYLREMQ